MKGVDRELMARLTGHPLLRDGYVAGGAVRDALLGRELEDLDVVVPREGVERARALAREFNAPFVLLHREEGVARVVLPGLALDISQFRGGASSIQGDLALRDFTINAMAVPVAEALRLLRREAVEEVLVDPLGGVTDCREGRIRACSRECLASDPLRLLRAFRFQTQLGFEVEGETRRWIRELAPAIARVAAERIWRELEIMTLHPHPSRSWAHALLELHRHSLLKHLVPELLAGEGVEQPGFHHLDVFHHCIEAAAMAQRVAQAPHEKLKPWKPVAEWCGLPSHRLALLWAALLHDVAKPVCRGEKEGRPTFYHHDRTGGEMVAQVAGRLRWPGELRGRVARLVELHMRPFHLLNDLARGGPTKRAMRRLLKEIGPDYPGLFALAMADSMAGCGPLKPPDLDQRLSLLWSKVHHFYLRSMGPVERAPRLLTGHDVMAILGIGPGPRVGELLEGLEEARVVGEVSTREEAVEWIRRHGAPLSHP